MLTLTHLPETILWSILAMVKDIKGCGAVWCCSHKMYDRYDASQFWELMYHHNFGQSLQKGNHWITNFWEQYSQQYGCGYCGGAIKHKTYKDYIFLCGMNIQVCQRCKDILGDTIVNKKELHPWQSNLLRKMSKTRNNQTNPIHPFTSVINNYYGENQVAKCKSYYLRCTECLKNIRNIRCPNFCCGSCCHCKYHKSHYEQASPLDVILSFHVTNLIRHTNDKRKKMVICYKA